MRVAPTSSLPRISSRGCRLLNLLPSLPKGESAIHHFYHTMPTCCFTYLKPEDCMWHLRVSRHVDNLLTSTFMHALMYALMHAVIKCLCPVGEICLHQ